MTPPHQTIFGVPQGNCFATCIACLLDMKVDDVPNFCSMGDEVWWFEATEWCRRQRGLVILEVGYNAEYVERFHADVLGIASGKSPRGDFPHSVIYRGTKLLHDPHPDGKGLVGEPTTILYFVALDPGAVRSA